MRPIKNIIINCESCNTSINFPIKDKSDIIKISSTISKCPLCGEYYFNLSEMLSLTSKYNSICNDLNEYVKEYKNFKLEY